jgi:hypothetical protein
VDQISKDEMGGAVGCIKMSDANKILDGKPQEKRPL